MKEHVQKLETKLKGIFNHLHTHPEISWQEEQTTAYLKSLVKPLDCVVREFDEMTGLVVDLGSGGPVVALRADIDALWQEVDGRFQANHSCGHDAHMTIALGVLFTLLELGVPEKGTYRFIFQPAEETGEGALAFVDAGVVDDVDYLYGMHLRPIQELPTGYFAPAIDHGAAMLMKGEIDGDDAHGARPHLNSNAIQVGADLVQQLNNIHLDPFIPYSVKLTSFHAGDKSFNIIPGSASFSLDVRAQSNDAIKLLKEEIEQVVTLLSKRYRTEIKLQVETHIVAAELHEAATNDLRDAIVDSVGKEKLAPVIETTGGDDFHYYTVKRPEVKASMLGIGCDLRPGLHHPKMTFDFSAILPAVEILARAMQGRLERARRL